MQVQGLQVPELQDNSIWFANSAAWNNYWEQAEFTISMTVADPNNYGLVKAAATTAYAPVVPNTIVSVFADGVDETNH
mgnify:CR=1 FL=1